MWPWQQNMTRSHEHGLVQYEGPVWLLCKRRGSQDSNNMINWSSFCNESICYKTHKFVRKVYFKCCIIWTSMQCVHDNEISILMQCIFGWSKIEAWKELGHFVPLPWIALQWLHHFAGVAVKPVCHNNVIPRSRLCPMTQQRQQVEATLRPNFQFSIESYKPSKFYICSVWLHCPLFEWSLRDQR